MIYLNPVMTCTRSGKNVSLDQRSNEPPADGGVGSGGCVGLHSDDLPNQFKSTCPLCTGEGYKTIIRNMTLFLTCGES